LEYWAEKDTLAISVVTYAELAAGARTREWINEQLATFQIVDLDPDSAWRAGMAFRQYKSARGESEPVLPDFLIRGQAAANNWRHLTNDRRRTRVFPDVDWLWPDETPIS
jgi:hypothetical protein